MGKIAALTMVRNDDFFLGKWTEYYGSLLGKDNLYIFFDGEDQRVPSCTQGCNVSVIPRVSGNVRISDKNRINILSAKAASLLAEYTMVIGTDVDEFLTVDPALGVELPEFLLRQDIQGRNSLSGLGCDVIYDPSDSPLDESKPLLAQRRSALLSTRYTKTSVLCAPVQWGSGFHRTRKGDFHICEGLFLFHFGCADPSILGQKQADADLVSRGWSRHLCKRRRIIDTFPSLKYRDWESWTRKARRIQSCVRQIHLWNKPAMFNMKVKVRVPERFSSLF